MTTPLIERFRDRLPVSDSTPVVSGPQETTATVTVTYELG